MTAPLSVHCGPAERARFLDQGYLVLRGLIGATEVRDLRAEFMALHDAAPIPGFYEPVPADQAGGDMLKMYPRIINPHLINELARRYLLDARFGAVVGELLGEEPLAAQSMFYFKPPGGRGQALHQDNFYLRVEPGTCIAAWLACDRVDSHNGGLQVVPGTHRMDLFCPEAADSAASFTTEYVPPPPGLQAVPVRLDPGDVLFFNGSLIHGSPPNNSTDRFRRSFICHYVGRSTQRLSRWYRAPLTMSGEPVELPHNSWGGPCGTEADPGPH
jgi:ectoine hydroxylase-related dioxygenase (phytanoyl-CoA dioxygenase family)